MTEGLEQKICLALLEGWDEALLVITAAGRIEYANPAAIRLFGGAPEARLDGGAIDSLITGFQAVSAWSMETPPVGQMRLVTGLRRDGTRFEAEITEHPVEGGYSLLTVKEANARAAALEQLRKSQAQLKAFVDHAPIPIAMFDRDMNYLANSGRWWAEYGRGHDDLVGLNHYQIHPDLPEVWKEVHRRGFAGETIKNDEDMWVQADGTRHWLRWAVLPWTDEQGKIGGIIISAEDITARKRAEAALAEREAQYRAVAETAADGFWMVDREGRILAVNDAYVRRSGYSREELLTMRVEDLDATESNADVVAHIKQVEQTGTQRFETLHRAKDGSLWPVEINVSFWPEAGGHFFAFGRDISERRRAEEAILASEARYRNTFERAAVGIAHISLDGHWLRANRKLCDILGYSHDELMQLRFQDITHPDDLAADKIAIKRLIEGEIDTREVEKRYIRKDGSVVWIHGTGSMSHGADGKPEYYIVVIEDITERRQAQEAVRALRNEMEQLTRYQVARQTVAAIAHELHQPLNAISTYAEAAQRLMRAGNPQPEKLIHALEGSVQQAKRAGRVVRELLTFMKQGEVQTESLNLNELVYSALHRIHADGHAGFRTELDLDTKLPQVNANRLQIEKVLVNLIENGIEAMHGSNAGEASLAIQVKTARNPGMALVVVRDNGPGIDAQELAHVFDPFFTTKNNGLGMGLAISRAIVEAHGGQLWAESEPGSGAAFHFSLPFST